MINNETIQKKCPSCGASDISLNVETGKLKCNYCGTEFLSQEVEDKEIESLYGENFSEGTMDLLKEEEILTLKCNGCGAEIIINRLELSQARCHWCGSALSINQKIANGSVPDMILPFKVTRQEAKNEIDNFIGKNRKKYALKEFLNNLKEENIKGVYFPYMVVDVNAHAKFKGRGEITTKKYTIGSDDNKKTRYDAEVYDVKREFDITINDITIEANEDRFNTESKEKTNNIINAILPFDTENCVKWDQNYLRGYTLENRNLNVNSVNMLVDAEAKDIARHKANETLNTYDRGVKWEEEELSIKGTQWKMAYLPVWLYSYRQQLKDGKIFLNYIAVNGRTKETMGSVPMDSKKHFRTYCMIGLLIMLLFFIFNFFIIQNYNIITFIPFFLFIFISSMALYSKENIRYRNPSERHYHEKETKSEMFNIIIDDRFVKKEEGLASSEIKGRNNTNVYTNEVRRKSKN